MKRTWPDDWESRKRGHVAAFTDLSSSELADYSQDIQIPEELFSDQFQRLREAGSSLTAK